LSASSNLNNSGASTSVSLKVLESYIRDAGRRFLGGLLRTMQDAWTYHRAACL
jgi:hypothetical protein